MIFAPSSWSHHTHKNNLFFRFLSQTTYNKNRLFTFIFWASTLAPASNRRLITVVFPARTAQCNAVFLWYLSPRLTETLNVSSNRVGSTLEKKSLIRSTKEFNTFQLPVIEFNFYTEYPSLTLCRNDIFVDYQWLKFYSHQRTTAILLNFKGVSSEMSCNTFST